MKYDATRIAVVGFGAIAERHIEVFRALGADVCASCNRSEEGRARARASGGIPRTYADPVEMVEREKPNGLLVTPSVMSIEGVARQVIPFGLPILLEKPPGLSLAETEELALLAKNHKTPVMVGLNRRFYSVYHRALETMGGREAVTSVSVEWSEDPVKMVQLGHPAELLPLLNYANSLHGIDLLTFFAGEIPSPSTWGRNLDPEGMRCRWQMSLDGVSHSGIKAHFDSNWDVPGRWRLVVDAPDARMVSAPLESALVLIRHQAPREVTPSGEDLQFKPGFYGQAEHFLRLIQKGGQVHWPACSLREACVSMRIAGALTTACLYRMKARLSETPRGNDG